MVSSAPVGMGDAQRDPAWGGVAVDAFMADVQAFAVAVEQFPQPGGGEQALGIGIGRVVGQLRHRARPAYNPRCISAE